MEQMKRKPNETNLSSMAGERLYYKKRLQSERKI